MLTTKELELIKEHNLQEEKALNKELEVLRFRNDPSRMSYIHVRLAYIKENLTLIEEIKQKRSGEDVTPGYCACCKRPL